MNVGNKSDSSEVKDALPKFVRTQLEIMFHWQSSRKLRTQRLSDFKAPISLLLQKISVVQSG